VPKDVMDLMRELNRLNNGRPLTEAALERIAAENPGLREKMFSVMLGQAANGDLSPEILGSDLDYPEPIPSKQRTSRKKKKKRKR
jgi:hypothetical protein